MIYEKIIPESGHSFSKRNFIFKHFPSDWHYHPEFEIIVITEGFGKRFVGNGIDDFKAGDIVLIGDNVPHFHMSDKVYYANNDLYCCSEAIQFTRDVFPANMDTMPEFSRIVQLLKNSEQGIYFRNQEVTKQVLEITPTMEGLSSIEMLIKLYEILDLLGSTSGNKSLSTSDYEWQHIKNQENSPVYKTYQYLMNNFKEPIGLEEVAKYACQNQSALCRNFKLSTGKSIFECLIEIRMDFAYKLLANSDLNIIQVAYESGFRNISNFNHRFKSFAGVTPLTYRRAHKR